MRLGALAVVLVLVAAGCGDGSGPQPESGAASTTAPSAPDDPTGTAWAPPEHRIQIVDGRFVDTAAGGAPFVPRGVNLVRFAGGVDSTLSPRHYDRPEVDRIFGTLAAAGYNTVRIFLDSCSTGPGCMTRVGEPGIQDDHLDTVADVLGLAAEHDLVLLLTLNDLPDGGGYRQISARDDSPTFPGYRNSDFLTAAGHEAMTAVWGDVVAGLVERRARLDVVLGWSILNEHWLFTTEPPLSLDTGEAVTATGSYDLTDPEATRSMVVDATRALIAEVSAEIRRHDPGALVTMGFFAPQFPHDTDIGGSWYVDTAPLVEDSALDFFDFHAYPGADITIEQMAENFGVGAASKPVIMGEVGAFVDRYASVDAAALATQEWIATSCELGWSGWLYWAHDRLPMADATWGLTDAAGRLLDVLSPAEQPDPCTPTLADPNLARGRVVRASRSIDGGPPEAAVDGSTDRSWWSGQDAPQWLEVDLETPATIGGVRLRVDQDPPGRTVHVVEVVGASGARREVHRFEGSTSFGDVLEATFAPPLTDVRTVRITTLSSPSWVAWAEVEVLAP